MAIRTCLDLGRPLIVPVSLTKSPSRNCKFSVQSCSLSSNQSHKQLVLEVKEKLGRDYHSLPVGKNGRDDEEMILWFLKDRRFSVEEAVSKLNKAIKWREEFRVSELSEESVKSIVDTGKAYVHDSLDVYGKPVLIVVASKHFPSVTIDFSWFDEDFMEHDPVENEKLCVFLIEKALGKLVAGKEQILGIFDLRGFSTKNADLTYLTFLVSIFYGLALLAGSTCEWISEDVLWKVSQTTIPKFDVFYYYYPKRLGQVLFVEAPFIFKPIWQVAKPLLRSNASLVRFCSVETVRKEYFTEETLPASFREKTL
ncbi:hypothetical protein DKX38_022760 [Salix brachista]|uniref:CRAL-TRIO domain-containing protein n=1 Tax=Salix brachista TaxID=2182728 RepID=A0A5N5K0C1_9ROSI|nr:hypothetical protein DKX38_022760 [Salix brachista]